jgi:small-conductance mechanosensitive channel
MSEDGTGPADGLGNVMRMWFDMASAAMAPFQGRAGEASAADALKQAREIFFKAWSDSCASFLRSPAFSATQKQLMTGSVAYRKQVRQYLERLHHEFELPTCQDIDHLVRALEQLDRRVEEQFEEITDRLDQLAARLDALAVPGSASNRNASNPAERPAKRRARPDRR